MYPVPIGTLIQGVAPGQVPIAQQTLQTTPTQVQDMQQQYQQQYQQQVQQWQQQSMQQYQPQQYQPQQHQQQYQPQSQQQWQQESSSSNASSPSSSNQYTSSTGSFVPQAKEISGIITYMPDAPRGGKYVYPVTFKVRDSSENRIVSVDCAFFCRPYKDDLINAVCIPKDGNPGHLTIVRPPFFQTPSDKNAIVSYFIKMLNFKGIGDVTATRMYDALSKAATDRDLTVEAYVDKLAIQNKHRKGGIAEFINNSGNVLSNGQATMLLVGWYERRLLRRLHCLGLNNREIRLTGIEPDELYARLTENPYTIPSIPMPKCLEILRRMNKEPNSVNIRRGEMVRFLYEHLIKKKNMATKYSDFVSHFGDVIDHFDALGKEYHVEFDNKYNCAYLEYPYFIETKLTEFIMNLVRSNPIRDDTPFDQPVTNPDGTIGYRISAKFKSENLSDEQKRAIQGALDGTCIITGPPGTGKSTIIKEIVYNLELRNQLYLLCSFTGKAVDRMKQVTGSEKPVTINKVLARGHELLSSRSQRSLHIITDEMSMTRSTLYYDLLDLFSEYKLYLVMVGDHEQLEPIEWGSIFEQAIESGAMPTFKLNHNYRIYDVDGEVDGIVMNTRAMMQRKEGESFRFIPTSNFHLIEGNVETIYEMVKHFYAQGIKSHELTVITPYKKYLKDINTYIQGIYNDGNNYVTDKQGTIWMEGDRVIMNVNDYVSNVMNGCEGIVTMVTPKAIEVKFNNNPIKCEFPLDAPNAGKGTEDPDVEVDLDYYGDNGDEPRSVRMLKHSYCLTGHKAQGSEYTYCIVWIPPPHDNGRGTYRGRGGGKQENSFINRRWLNTAITRARRACYCVGSMDQLQLGALTIPPRRNDNTGLRMREYMEPLPTEI